MTQTEQLRKRHVAYKLRVCDILNSSYIKSGDFPNYIDFGGKEVSRINVIGVVVESLDFESYKSIVIDDGTGRISARIFEKNLSFDKTKIGDFVVVIGRPREFLSEKYILVEIVKKVDGLWAKARSVELGSFNYKKDILEPEDFVFNDGLKSKVVKAIKNLDRGEGVSVEEILSISDNNDKIIDALLKDGDVFEIKSGKLKVLE